MIEGYDVKAVMVAGRAGLIRRAWAVPARRKLMFVEALCRVCAAWVMIRLLPYRLWRSRLGTIGDTGKPDSCAPTLAHQLVGDVAWAHRGVERLFGTAFTCLMLALSARDMLAWRGVSSSLVLGVAREATGADSRRIGAHAWVKRGDRYVVGMAGSERFTPVATYRLDQRCM